jgi:hypothetical protein
LAGQRNRRDPCPCRRREARYREIVDGGEMTNRKARAIWQQSARQQGHDISGSTFSSEVALDGKRWRSFTSGTYVGDA